MTTCCLPPVYFLPLNFSIWTFPVNECVRCVGSFTRHYSRSVYGIVYLRFHCFLDQIILLWMVSCLLLASHWLMDYFHHLAIVNGTCRNIRGHGHGFPFLPVLTLGVGSPGLALHCFSVRQCQGVGLLHILSSACC